MATVDSTPGIRRPDNFTECAGCTVASQAIVRVLNKTGNRENAAIFCKVGGVISILGHNIGQPVVFMTESGDYKSDQTVPLRLSDITEKITEGRSGAEISYTHFEVNDVSKKCPHFNKPGGNNTSG